MDHGYFSVGEHVIWGGDDDDRNNDDDSDDGADDGADNDADDDTDAADGDADTDADDHDHVINGFDQRTTNTSLMANMNILAIVDEHDEKWIIPLPHTTE